MKRILICILTLSLLLTLAACGGNHTNGAETPKPDAQQNNPDPQPDPQPGNSSDLPDSAGITALTAEELAQWTEYFNKMEHNGLLRFPYANLDETPDQLAPYLVWLFYDIGESESTFTDEEKALLDEAGLWLELDAFRLSREFMNSYLFDHFNIPAENTENLLDAANLGIYLMEYDAWYIAHGDTNYNPYTMTEGYVSADGTVQLYYFNNFLCVAQEDGEEKYADTAMVITLVPREDGTYYVVSHEIAYGTWNQ